MKEASLLSSSFGLRGRLQVWHMSSGLQSYSQGIDVVLPLSLCLAPAHQYLIHLSGALIFATAQVTPPDCLALVASRVYAVVILDYIYLHTFKSCCLRVQLPVSLILGAEILPSGTLIGLGTYLTTGSY